MFHLQPTPSQQIHQHQEIIIKQEPLHLSGLHNHNGHNGYQNQNHSLSHVVTKIEPGTLMHDSHHLLQPLLPSTYSATHYHHHHPSTNNPPTTMPNQIDIKPVVNPKNKCSQCKKVTMVSYNSLCFHNKTHHIT